MGRDSTYTPELDAEICERLALGESLRGICEDLHMPHLATVLRWVQADEDFREHYAQAREAQAEFHADELIDISDNGRNDWMERQTRDGGSITVVDSEHIQRSKLRVDTRKWIAANLLPKKYGNRVALEHSGPGGRAIKTEVTDERRAALTIALLTAVGSPLLGQRIDGNADLGSGAEEPPAA